MFATIKNLIPEPRQSEQPRGYVGRHRRPEPVPQALTPPVVPQQQPAPQPEKISAA